MASASDLSVRDQQVLRKMQDPEYGTGGPGSEAVTDPSLPRDPHILDADLYSSLVREEGCILGAVQAVEAQLAEQGRQESGLQGAVARYRDCLARLDRLVAGHPDYASARNNRAQAIRRLYGDTMLLQEEAAAPARGLLAAPDRRERRQAATTALQDLERSIGLLSPARPGAALSPQAARTLSMAHTQRAAIYLATSKMSSEAVLDLDEDRPEAGWSRLGFEEAASRDFALGGRYGNPIAQGLAVSVNPTAKLCGQIVREAIKEEYGSWPRP